MTRDVTKKMSKGSVKKYLPLLKLVSQEFNFNASDSVYATYYHYIRQIRRHHFD